MRIYAFVLVIIFTAALSQVWNFAFIRKDAFTVGVNAKY